MTREKPRSRFVISSRELACRGFYILYTCAPCAISRFSETDKYPLARAARNRTAVSACVTRFRFRDIPARPTASYRVPQLITRRTEMCAPGLNARALFMSARVNPPDRGIARARARVSMKSSRCARQLISLQSIFQRDL